MRPGLLDSQSPRHGQIVSSSPVQWCRYRYMASLRYNDDVNTPFCGGTLIHPLVVLTAGHVRHIASHAIQPAAAAAAAAWAARAARAMVHGARLLLSHSGIAGCGCMAR